MAPPEEDDMLRFVTTLEARTPNHKGNTDEEILKRWDSMASPNITFGNYKEDGIRGQMWMASFISDRVLNSFDESEYDPLILAKIKSIQAVIYAKLTLGREGPSNFLKVVKSIWSHTEAVTNSRHDESIRAKGMTLNRRGR